MKKFFAVFIFFIITLFLIINCDNISKDIPFPEKEIINSNIRKLGLLDQETERTLRTGPIGDCVYNYDVYIGSFTYININPYLNSIFPGALIDGESILKGDYKSINVKRRNVNISLSSHTNTDYKTLSVNPVYANVSRAMDGVSIPPIPQLQHNMESVYSLDHLKTLFPVHLNSEDIFSSESIFSVFNFDDDNVNSRKLMQFIYTYYTATVEKPEKPADFFDPDVTWAEIEQELSSSVSPAYVSSVQYGKMGFLFIESVTDDETLTSALNYAIDDISGVPINEDYYKQLLDGSKVYGLTVGQNENLLLEEINGFHGIREFMSELRDYSDITSCKPLIYSLNYLKNDEQVRVVLKASYQKRECEDLLRKVTIWSINEGGVPVARICEARYQSVMPLITVKQYTDGNAEYHFCYWEELRDNAWVIEPNNHNTVATHFADNSVICARYSLHETTSTTSAGTTSTTSAGTSSTTSAGTSSTTSAGTSSTTSATSTTTTTSVASTTTSVLPPTYTLTINYYDSNGNLCQETRPDRSADDVESICTTASYSPNQYVTLTFVQWHVSGNATIDNATSTCTNVRNFSGNVTVNPEYKTN